MLKLTNKRFVRFLMVGFVNTGIGYSMIFVLLNILNAGYFLSTIIGYSVGSIISFLLNRFYTFKHQGDILRTYFKYFIIFIISYILSYYSGKICIELLLSKKEVLDIPVVIIENIGVVFGMVVYIVINYFGNSLFTFTDNE